MTRYLIYITSHNDELAVHHDTVTAENAREARRQLDENSVYETIDTYAGSLNVDGINGPEYDATGIMVIARDETDSRPTTEVFH